MNKFMRLTAQFKFLWGIIFAAAILLYSVIGFFTGETAMSFLMIWQFVLVTLILTLIYFLIFGEYILASRSTKLRLLVHYILNYITLLVSGWAIGFIDLGRLSHILIFTAGLTLIYLLLMLSFHIYYKATGEELNDKLSAYKKRKTMNS